MIRENKPIIHQQEKKNHINILGIYGKAVNFKLESPVFMVCIVPAIKLVSVLLWNKLDKISACIQKILSGLAYIEVSINTIKLIKNVKIML